MALKKQNRSAYQVISATPSQIVIIDCGGDVSVTNDASRVVDELFKSYNGLTGKRIFYRDSLGTFDELVVADGIFAGYRACTQVMRHELNLLAANQGVETVDR